MILKSNAMIKKSDTAKLVKSQVKYLSFTRRLLIHRQYRRKVKGGVENSKMGR